MNTSAVRASRSGSHVFGDPTSRSETFRNPGCLITNGADLGEILEGVTVMDEGGAESWYAAWKATADLALALANRTQESLGKGRA